METEKSPPNKKRKKSQSKAYELVDTATWTLFKDKSEELKTCLEDDLKPLFHKLTMLWEDFNREYKRLLGLSTIHDITDKINGFTKRFNGRKKEFNKVKEALDTLENKSYSIIQTKTISNETFFDLSKLTTTSQQIKKKLESQNRLVGNAKKSFENEAERLIRSLKGVKKCVVKGDEFQRILQVLLRQRALLSDGAEVGIEVAGVGSLDDVVYRKTQTNKCRFFQMKHSEKKELVSVEELFKYNPDNEDGTSTSGNTRENKNKTMKNLKPDLHLLMYFQSFCKIKEHREFKNCDIEEVTIITNRALDRPQRKEGFSLLIEKGRDFENDDCLDFEGRKAKKYGLHVTEAKEKYFELLLTESKKYLSKKITENKAIIDEFLEKIHIVVDYLDLKDLRKRTFNEVFHEEIFSSIDRDIFENSILYSEIQLLQSPNEFTNNDDWKSRIIDIKNLILSLKSVTLSDMKRQDMQNEACLHISIENVDDIYKDIKQLIEEKTNVALECMGPNVKINFIKVIHILQTKFSGKKFLFCDFDQLLTADFLLQSFDSGKFEILVVMCKITLLSYEEHFFSRLKTALEKSKKMIIVSDECFEGKNTMTNALKEFFKEKYFCKKYNHGFKNLTPSCKENIQNLPIVFQNIKLTFGDLINENLADIVIDDDGLWNILEKSKTRVSISDEISFCSPGYNKDYYIQRKFYQKTVPFKNVRMHLGTNVFYVTRKNDITEENVKKVFTEHSIDEKFIKNWEDRTLYANGVFLCKNNTLVNNQLSDLATTTKVHLMCMNESAKRGNLILIDSTEEIFAENELIQGHKREMINERELLNLAPKESTDGKTRLFILVGDSGVGKSTTLTSVANKIRESCPNIWVSRVVLRSIHVMRVLEKLVIKSPNDAINVVSEISHSGQSSSSLEKKLVREGLKTLYKGTFRFILLLDGFNEINSALQEKLITLIKTLRDYCNIDQIWITTQYHEKVKLETELEVTSYFLKPLDDEDQVNLMVKYWQREYKHITPAVKYDSEKLSSDAALAIKQFKSYVNDSEKRIFTENSLNLKMLAEVLLHTERKMNEQMKIFDLYEKFIQQKFSIYRRETAPCASSSKNDYVSLVSTQDKLFEKFLRHILQQFAVKSILSSDKTKKDFSKILKPDAYNTFKSYVGETDCELSLSKLGIVTFKKNYFDFVHPSFAEFFFCDYLINNLSNLHSDLTKFLVKNVLTATSFQSLRRFLDRALCKLEESHPHELVKVANKLATTNKNFLIKPAKNISTPFKENLYYVSLFILRWLQEKDYEEYLTIVLNQAFVPCSMVDKNIGQIIAYFCKCSKQKTVKQLINFYTSIKRTEELQSTILAIPTESMNE